MKHSILLTLCGILMSFSAMANDTIRIYSNGCDDYQTFIGPHGGQLTMTANSDQWSHFVRWNDGNTDNPRTITTNGNADYTAYFEAPTGIDNTVVEPGITKILRNGEVLILRDGKTYTLQGVEVR